MSRNHPPKLFSRLFRVFCHPDFHEELEGDLIESFERNIEERNLRFARRRYRMEVLRLFRPSVIKELRFNMFSYLSPDMIRNNLVVGFRNIMRDRTNSTINILGLTLALTCALFILLFVNHEFQVDRQFADSDRIYRMTNDERPFIENGRFIAALGPPAAGALVDEFPEVEYAVRLRHPHDVILSHNTRQFYENHGFYADKDFFQLFDMEFAAGDPATALQHPNCIVITADLANKYFGREDVIGQELMFNTETPLKVTGVLRGSPAQSHLEFDYLISFETFEVPYGYPVTMESWGWVSFPTYVMLRQGVEPGSLDERLDDLVSSRMYVDRPVRSQFRLQPLGDIYFHSQEFLHSEDYRTGSLAYLYGLLAIAVLILLVASFNYMNIATAQSLKRSREVGVRKVMGAMRGHLVSQFVGESLILTFSSLLIAILVFRLLGQQVMQAFQWDLTYSSRDFAAVVFMLVVLAFVLTLLSSLYPAAVMSAFKPVKVLKGAWAGAGSKFNMKKGLVVVQFAITVGLIACSLVVRHQMAYMQNKELGYDKEQLVSLKVATGNFTEFYRRANSILSQNPHVVSLTAGDVFDDDYGSVPVTPAGSEVGVAMNLMGGYFNYFTALGIHVVDGRDFSTEFPRDTQSGIVVNESAVRFFGWDEPLGQRLQVNNDIEGEVIGVVEDFHYRSLHDPVEPLVVVVPRTHISNLILRVRPMDDIEQTIASLQADWTSIAPDQPFQFSFLDEALDARYTADKRFAAMIRVFSLIAILISGLGLYGLIAIIVRFKVKEIGIRKVLGASISDLAVLLSRQFLVLILIANAIGIPLAVLVMGEWLQNFTYRTSIPLYALIIAVGISLLLGASSLSYQVIRSALRSPVESLRSE